MKKISNERNNYVGATTSDPHIEEITKNNVGAGPVSARKERGITLIALIITIIVMLILVAVSISIALNTGLFESAGKATSDWQAVQDKEQEVAGGRIQIGGIWYDSIEKYNEKIPSDDQGNVEKTVSKYKTLGIYAKEETTLEDDEKNTMVLPAGFKIATASATVVNDGVVVEDEEGNQYVWVPVTKDAEGGNTTPYAETGTLADGTEIKLGRYAFNSEGVETDKTGKVIISRDYYGWTWGTETWKAFDESVHSASIDYPYITKPNNIEEFKASVAENGGYYIARYEASLRMEDGKAMSKVSIAYEGNEQDGLLYNYVTQPKASEACQNLYLNVKSDLINSYAWDTAILYIQKCSENTTYSLETSKNDTIQNTGTNEDEVCKIHDLASNLGEWSTEASWFPWCGVEGTYSGNAPIPRGGRFSNNFDARSRGEDSPEWEVIPTDTSEDMGFRAILYI